MKIKRFFAKDMRMALHEVKETLGDEAIIMSNKKVHGGIEIIAAVDYNEKQKTISSNTKIIDERKIAEDNVNLSTNSNTNKYNLENHSNLKDDLADFMRRNNLNNKNNKEQSEKVAKTPINNTKIISKNADINQNKQNIKAINALQDEVKSLRKLLEHQISGLMWQEVEREEPIRAFIIKILQQAGFSEVIADQLALCIPEDCSPSEAWINLKEVIAEQLDVGNDDIIQKGGVISLVGATGVGKTTTIAKLAAQFALENSPESMVLITTDTYRIGAHEQLSTYGKIMGCSVKVAHSEEELSDLLSKFKDKKLILIDTAGMSQRDIRLHEQLDKLINSNHDFNINNYLVLPANAQRRVIEETVQQFNRVPIKGAIITKLDESLALGEILDVILLNSLPISYVTYGQRVPEDIDIAVGESLVNQALSVVDQDTQSHFWASNNSNQ